MAASNFTNLYNNGEWGYMGIGPMPAKSFTLTLKADSDNPIFTLGACDYTHIVAYNPNNTSQYAVYSGTSFTVYNNGGSFELVTVYGGVVEVPDEQTITIDYDPSKWDFHGLESLEGAALCIATNEYGYSPDSHDYASISTARKSMFWYEVNVIVMVDKINDCDIYAKRAELDANGNVISSVPASTSADENKVLTVNSSGNAEWAAPVTPSVDEVPTVESTDDGKVLTASYSGGVGSYSWETAQGGGGASYTASAPITIESDDIKLNYDDTLKLANKFTVTSTSADANNTSDVNYFNGGCYGLYVYNTGVNLPTAAGSLAILYKKPSNYYQDMKITGAAAAGATGWTVVIYDPKAPTSNYCIANEEYEFAGVSGDDAIVFKTYSSADTNIYYKFTFSTANCHGTVTGDLLGIQIIPLPTSATSGSSCAGTTYLNMVNQGHSGNYNFAVYGTITPISELPAADTGSFSNPASELSVNGTNAVPVDPSQFTKTTKSVITAGAVGDTLGTYGYMGVKNNAAFRTGEPYVTGNCRFSFKWAANGSWLYDQSSAFTTSQTLASDVRVLFYNISNPSQYCEFTGITGLGFNWTTYTVGIIGNYWDQSGVCYGPNGMTSTMGYWSIDFTIDRYTSKGTNTTYMDWQNIVTNQNYAICFYTPGTTGTAPNGCDYSSIPAAILAKFGTVSDAGLLKVQDKLLLPSSTSADYGKVLTVNAVGKASWNEAPGTSGINEVFDWEVVSTTNIANCLANGRNPIIRYEFSTDLTQYAYLESIDSTQNGFAYTFYTPVSGTADNSSKTMTRLYLTDWNVKTASRSMRVSMPSCSSTDAGKVLTVDSLGYAIWDFDKSLPSYSSADVGKVLQVQNDGTLAWVTLS